MKVSAENIVIMPTAITVFTGQAVSDINRFNKSWVFCTDNGNIGFVEENEDGNYDVWINEKVVYEIEKELYKVLDYDKHGKGFIDLYNLMRRTNTDGFAAKSRQFWEVVKKSTENIILSFDHLPIYGRTIIDSIEVLYTKRNKIKINLN